METHPGDESRQPKTKGKELLLMTVDIGDGRQDMLQIDQDDDPKVLANRFSSKHQLSPGRTNTLEVLIKHNKAAALQYLSTPSKSPLSPLHDSPSQISLSPQDPISRKPTKNWIGSIGRNYGEWLYQKGVQDRKKTVRTGPNDPEATFRPKINAQNQRRQRTEDLLLEKGKDAEDRLKSIRKKVFSAQFQECTFRPKIDHRSQKLSSKHESAKSRYEILYQDAKVKAEQKEANFLFTVKTEFSYQPQIINRRHRSETREGMLDRLAQSKPRFDTRIDEIKGEIDSKSLSVGENELFRPATGRGPQSPRYIRTQPVHEHLYQLRKYKDRVTEEIRERIESQRHVSPGFTNAKSRKLFDQLRRRQLERLFRQLDGDRDGLISFETISAQPIDERTLVLLSPIWDEMRASGLEYDLDWFLSEAEATISLLSIEEKDYLLKKNHAPESQDMIDDLEKPRLSPLSRTLASKRFEGTDVYTRYIQDKELSEQKLSALKANLLEKEVSECTFQPETTKYVRS